MTGTSVAIPEKMSKVSFKQDVTNWIPQLQQICHRGMDAEAILAEALNIGLKNDQLFKCEPKSIFLALAKCARLGLYPGGGIDLVPLSNSVKVGGKWEKVLQLEAWVGYHGLKALARRQGIVRHMDEYCHYEHEDLERTQGMGAYLRHTPKDPATRGKLVGAYSIILLPRGIERYHYMALADIETIRAKSRTWGPTAHPECPDWYAMKTVVRDYLSRQPKEGALAEALTADDAAPARGDMETGEVSPPPRIGRPSVRDDDDPSASTVEVEDGDTEEGV